MEGIIIKKDNNWYIVSGDKMYKLHPKNIAHVYTHNLTDQKVFFELVSELEKPTFLNGSLDKIWQFVEYAKIPNLVITEEASETKVTRVEVIDNTGRAYVKYGVNNLELSYQDDGRTLKIFIK